MFKLIKDVDHEWNNNWALTMRLVRKYKLISPNNAEDVYSLECIFHDSKGKRIHVTIPKTLIQKWQGTLKEGFIYFVRKFYIADNINYKVTTHNLKIRFNLDTYVKKIYDVDFSNCMFSFRSFEQILKTKNPITDGDTFDVIGFLLSTPQAKKITLQTGAQKDVMDIILQDLQGERITYTFWGSYVHSFLNFLNSNREPSNVIIIQFVRAVIYQDKPKVQTSTHVSRIFVNSKIPEIDDLKKRLIVATDSCTTIIGSSMSSSTNSSLTNDNEDDFQLLSIDEILFKDEDRFVWIVGRILNIDLENGWFVHNCKKCNTELLKDQESFYCVCCKANVTSYDRRYRLIIDVMGDDGKTGTTLSLSDIGASQLIGTKVDELLRNQKDVNDFPQSVYDSIIDTKALIQISLSSSQNTVNGTYSVHQVSKKLTSIDAYNRSKVEEESIKLSKSKMKQVLVENTDVSDLTDFEDLEDGKHVKRNLDKELQDSECLPQKKKKVYTKKEK